MALNKQKVTDDGKKTTTEKPKTQTVTVGGREINVPSSAPKTPTAPKTSNTSNVTVGGRELSQSQKNDKTVSNAIKNTASKVVNNAKAKVQQDNKTFVDNNRQYQQQGNNWANQRAEQSNPLTRNDFNTDRDYENYILDNKIDYTKGEAKNYLQQRSVENGTTSMKYMEGMRSRYKNTRETEKIEEKVKNGEYADEKLADINNRFYALVDNDGNEVDIDTYNNEANMIGTTYDELNNRLKKIDKDYYDGKIDYQTRVNEYDRINALWNENTANAERLQSYKQVSGFDYYDWAKSVGKDVTDFEAYAENLNDNGFERLAQAFGASWWDTLATRPEMLSIVRTALDPNYDIRDDKLSTSMRATANELREYAFAGSTGFEKWSVMGLSALMPMINETMINQVLPLDAIVSGYSSLTGATMTAEQTAMAVSKLAGNLTNVNLGIQTAGEVLRQRLDEGNNKLTALADASIHGVITAMVEGMDAGSTINFLTGGIGKHLATLSIFGKPSVLRTLGNMALSGHDEGKEEVIETTGVFLADSVLNAVSSIANSFGIDALQKVNVDPLNIADMANEYALAFYGTAVLGAPASVGDFIDTKKQYNSILKAREHFESVLNTPLASNLEKTLAKKSIENIDYALGTSPVAESEIAKAVTTDEDFVEPLPTYDELMNELANAMRPDVQDDIQRVKDTIDYSEYLKSQMQKELDERGLNSTVDRFMSTDDKTRDEIMRSSDFLNDNNIESFILKMKRGLNGVRTEGGVLLNTDQSASYDIDKVADMSEEDFTARMDLEDSEMLRDAGIAPSMIRSAFHESSHWAEQSDLWLNVRNMVRDIMGADRFDTFTNRIKRIYDKQGIEVENPETETVAFYLQKYLDDPKFLERMARYNSSFLNRFFSNAIAKLKGDEKTKLQNLYLDALRDAQNSATQELAPAYSVSSLFQAIGMTIHKESEVYNDDGSATTTFYAEDENGNKVREVTEEMVKNSPLGQMLQEAEDRGFIKESDNQVKMVATIYNSILKSQDPEMFWAVFGSIGFGRARVGTSSWDVSRPQHFASFTTNSDPQYGHTFDVTTICTKTQQLIDVASETMKRLNRGLTEDEIIDIVYNEVFKAGEPVPCPVCYVFSRWVGIGGVLENIKNFQEKYKGANLDELRDRYEALSKQVDEISEKRGIRGSKAIEELRKQTDQEVVDRYETLFGQEIVERMGGKKLTAEEKAEFESLKKDLEVLNDWAWLTRVVLDVKVKKGVRTIKVNKDYTEIGDVPNDILFNLNKGEDFAKYPAWKYRASRGQRYGKIIAPYSDMVLGQTIMGFANPSDSSIKSLGQKRDKKSNAFLDMKKVRKQNQLYDKAVANARVQNLKNGSRAQSTSDFRFEYITDYILHFMQLQSIGSYGQTYTKVPEAVPVLCSVGYEVNMSLMPKGKGYKPAKKGDPYAYYVEGFEGVKDGWYTIDCSSVTGINPDVAFYLRTQYDNAQTIMVGINDVHMFLCRQDPRVDFIIPYHASGGSAEHYASMMNTVNEGADLDVNDRVDYSEVSNENEEDLPVLTEDQKYARELREKILTQNLPNPTEEEIRFMQQGTGILWNLWNRFYVEGVDSRCYQVDMGKKPAIFPYEYWDETSTRENADINGMRYVQYCKELGYRPKFESLSNGDGSGGYWKCLPDRSMYNVDGTSHIQKAINMDNFSSDFLYKGKIQEGIVQPIAEQENIPLDENDPRYQELRKRVLSQQFNKEKTMPIVDDVLKRIKDKEIKIQASASGKVGWENLLKNGTFEEQERAMRVLADLDEADDAMTYFEHNPQAEGVMSPYQIWRKYGWVKKSDGKWRYQFYDGADETAKRINDFLDSVTHRLGADDNFAKDFYKVKSLWAKDSITGKSKNESIDYRLSRFVGSDNILFKMYPELKKMKIRFYYDENNFSTHGFTRPSENLIAINFAPFYLMDDSDGDAIFDFGQDSRNDMLNTFFHELQHAIQGEEHFESGSNMLLASEDWESEKTWELNSKMEELIGKAIDIGMEYDKFFDAVGKFLNTGEVSNLSDEEYDLVEEYASLRWQLTNLDDYATSKEGMLEILDFYKNNLGEVEAREEAERAIKPSLRGMMPRAEGKVSQNRRYQFEIGEGFDQSDDTVASEDAIQNRDAREKVAQILEDYPSPKDSKDIRRRAKLLAEHYLIDRYSAVNDIARRYHNEKLIHLADKMMRTQGLANVAIFNGIYDKEGKTKIGKSLMEIMGKIPNDQRKLFDEYMYNYRNIDEMSMVERFGDEYEDRPVLGKSVTAEDSRKRVAEIEKEHPEFKAIAEDMWKLNQQLLKMRYDAGIISKEAYEKFLKERPHYVRIMRDVNGSGTGASSLKPNDIKKFKGGHKDILPLEYASRQHILSTYKTINANELNNEIIKTLGKSENENINTDELGILLEDGFEPLLDARSGKKMFAYKGGKKISAPISDELYKSLSPSYVSNALTELGDATIARLSKGRRALLTNLNPLFSLFTNPMKDIQDAFRNTKYLKKYPRSLIEAVWQVATDGDISRQYDNLGLASSQYVGKNVFDAFAQTENDKGFKKFLNELTDIGEKIEKVPRLAEFISALKEGKSVDQASYDSAEVTTNFKRGGTAVKTMDKYGFTFLNASVQGFDKQIRNAKGDLQKIKKNGIKGVLSVLVQLTLASGIPLRLLQEWLWRDDDDYQNLSDYVKNNYYIVGKNNGRFIRFHKGRIASFYQTVASNIYKTVDKQVDVWDALLDDLQSFADNVAPNNFLDNNLTSPLFQAFGTKEGRTWYGEDLVPTRLQNVPDYEQFDESTDLLSIEIGKLSKKIADALGNDKFQISPYKFNYLLDQYTGIIGDVALPAMSLETTVPFENPVAKGVATAVLDKFTTDPILKNQNVTSFYSLKELIDKRAKGSEATDEEKIVSKYLGSVSSEMGKLYGEKRKIQLDKTISNKEKLAKVREIQTQINELAKEALANYDNIDMAGDFASVGGVQYYKNADGSWTKPTVKALERLNSAELSMEDRNAYFKTYTDIDKIREEIKLNTPEGQKADYTKDTIDAINKSELSFKGKNVLYDSYYSSKFVDHVNSMNLSDEEKYYLKIANKTAEGEKDKNGKTIANSKARAVAENYRKLGLLESVLEYIRDNDLAPSEMGLSKSVYNELIKGIGGSSSSKKKTSSGSGNGSSNKIKGGSAGGINTVRGGGSLGKLKASPMASNPDHDKSIANNFFRAYANTFRRGSKNVSSASGSTVVCPKCGNRVSSASGRCPVCGQSL